MLNVVDLFCGAGGFSQGFKDAGFNILLGIDNKEHKLKVFKKNLCANTLKADLSLLHGYEVQEKINNENVDVIIGSPPCKDFSTCKPAKHLDTFLMNSSILSYHFLRMVILLKPKWFVMENLKGYFLSLDGEFIRNLFEVFGYSTSLLKLDAVNLGIPQYRERVFLIGNRIGLCSNIKTENKKRVSIRDAISDLEGYNLDPDNIIGVIELGKAMTPYQKLMRSSNNKVKNHIPTKHKNDVLTRIASLKEGESCKEYPNYRRPIYDNPSRAITTRFDIPSGQGESIHPNLNRSFTPREAARLQSFKDTYEFFGTKEQIREQIGDSVPPLMAQEIAEKILAKIEQPKYNRK